MPPIFLGIIGFSILITGAHLFVNGSINLARILRISDLIIGLTVVAFGTSAPELFVNLMASLNGNSQLALGDICGSNIFNIFFILGASAIIYPLKVTKATVWKEIPFSLLAAILVLILANDIFMDRSNISILGRVDGLVLLCFFIIFIYYLYNISRGDIGRVSEGHDIRCSTVKTMFLMALGFAGLIIGGRLVVNSALSLASILGVSESAIGLSIVAIGTSLPELVTSAVAAYKKNADIAVGNIVGSNIFNIFLILGISSIINPIPLSAGNNIDYLVLILASLFLFISMFSGKRHTIDRWEGALSIVIYIIYLSFLIKRSV
ncbi:MAG: calcium/sodium antiporter [Candidatus Omnitrophota bacterium]